MKNESEESASHIGIAESGEGIFEFFSEFLKKPLAKVRPFSAGRTGKRRVWNLVNGAEKLLSSTCSSGGRRGWGLHRQSAAG